MDEQRAARLETAGARARALLGAGPGSGTATESAGASSQAPGAADVTLIAAKLARHGALSAEEAQATAAGLVQQAKTAVDKLSGGNVLTEDDSLALESVMQVRGRPALRIVKGRLEDLSAYPGSELWQTLIAQHEQRMLATATATGAAMASVFATGNPPWLQGTAWLIADDRVITNRHVLVSDDLNLLVSDGDRKKFGPGISMAIEFAADNRDPAASVRRNVTEVLYVSERQDPVDIAVLRIEGSNAAPLKFATTAAPLNLFVVGHPALALAVPEKVRAVFGNPDGRKRVSFGKRLDLTLKPGEFLHDASTIGGFSGGPVLGILDGTVAGLHYFGDPENGNMAITADTIRAHAAHQFCV
jgi:hypothetical protein